MGHISIYRQTVKTVTYIMSHVTCLLVLTLDLELDSGLHWLVAEAVVPLARVLARHVTCHVAQTQHRTCLRDRHPRVQVT